VIPIPVHDATPSDIVPLVIEEKKKTYRLDYPKPKRYDIKPRPHPVINLLIPQPDP